MIYHKSLRIYFDFFFSILQTFREFWEDVNSVTNSVLVKKFFSFSLSWIWGKTYGQNIERLLHVYPLSFGKSQRRGWCFQQWVCQVTLLNAELKIDRDKTRSVILEIKQMQSMNEYLSSPIELRDQSSFRSSGDGLLCYKTIL